MCGQRLVRVNFSDDSVCLFFQHFPNNQLMGDNALQNRVSYRAGVVSVRLYSRPRLSVSVCPSVCLVCLLSVYLSVYLACPSSPSRMSCRPSAQTVHISASASHTDTVSVSHCGLASITVIDQLSTYNGHHVMET